MPMCSVFEALQACFQALVGCLTSEPVQGAALALQGVHDVHGGHGLPAGVLGVGDSITDHVLEEHLEHRPGLFVDEARDALDTTTASKTADGWLGDALDVVTKDLAMALGAALSETFTSLSTSRHCWMMHLRKHEGL
jgi:hypothetical protein